MSHKPSALARCVGDPDVFASECWGSAPMLRRGAGAFGDLIDVDVVERLLGAPARRPMVRLVRGGSPVPFGEYGGSLRLGGVMVDDVVDVRRVMGLVSDGATVVLQSLQHSWPPIGRFCDTLQTETGHAVQANCYLSPPGSTALARHSDTHEVFVLQVEGSKAWDVDGLGELEIERGDVLYIPRGTRHEAAAQDRFSLHLTIGILATTYRMVLHRAVDDLSEALDRPLPLGFTSGVEQMARAQTLFATALDELAAVDPAVSVDRQIRRARSSRRAVPTGHLRTVLHDREVDECTWIRADPGLVTTVEEGALVLRAGDRRLTVPIRIATTVESLCRGESVAVGELHDLDAASRIVFARRLVRESLAFVVEGPIAGQFGAVSP